ncbi:MAG: pyridoxal-phosphate dependent enzyme [Candidatus Limnocylindrales bacterium]
MTASGSTSPSTLVCSGCGASPSEDDPYPFRCPNAGAGDDTDHVLRRRLDVTAVRFPLGPEATAEPNPYLRYRGLAHAYSEARAGGLDDAAYRDLVVRLDTEIARVDGHGFVATPFGRADALSERLGFAPDGGVWIKNETGNVSGSHKARHLFGVLVHLELMERLGRTDPAHRRRLAIASCGNAALAAAVVAAAGHRALDVFVPVDADPAVVERLRHLDAQITVCPREPGVTGDPTYHRLRRAISDGALPFTCQGNENGLAVEGGFTLGYELASDLAGGPPLDRLLLQVGGGALASACIEGLGEAVALGALARLPRFHAVQTAGGWPLPRAFERVAARVPAGAGPAERRAALAYATMHRSEFMWPWEDEPHSIAHGILDDETYDWVAVVEGLLESGGGAVVVGEDQLVRANALGTALTGICADETGSSGLAGLLELRGRGEIGDHERVGVLFTGVRR